LNPALDPAIQEDADVNGDAILAAHEQPTDPRLEAMEAIAARRAQAAVAAEPEAPKAEANDAQVDAQVDAQLDDDERTTVIDAASASRFKVRAKVDGQEAEIDLDKVLRTYQKAEAADKRLNEATAKLKEADEILARVKTQVAEPAKETQASAKPAASPDVKKKFREAIFSGDEEAVDSAIDELFSAVAQGRQEPTLDHEQLAKQIVPTIKKQFDIDSALEAFGKQYPVLNSDPYLSQRVGDIAQKKIDDGMSLSEALDAAGKETMDWVTKTFGVTTPAKSPTTTDTMTERQARKAEAASQQVGSASAKSAPKTEQPQTRQQIVDEMKKARGQLLG
jgi:hypothetical protein